MGCDCRYECGFFYYIVSEDNGCGMIELYWWFCIIDLGWIRLIVVDSCIIFFSVLVEFVCDENGVSLLKLWVVENI